MPQDLQGFETFIFSPDVEPSRQAATVNPATFGNMVVCTNESHVTATYATCLFGALADVPKPIVDGRRQTKPERRANERSAAHGVDWLTRNR